MGEMSLHGLIPVLGGYQTLVQKPTWFSAKQIGWVLLPRVLLGLILRFLNIKFEIPGSLRIGFLF
jgi:hypothetical protein